VTGNRIDEVYPEGIGEAVAISLNDTTLDCTIEGNVAKNAKRPATGRSIGIWVGTSTKPERRPALAIERNVVTGYDYAFFAPRELRRAVVRNDFAVFCPPADRGGYDGAKRANAFGKALKCLDTPAELKKLAAQGDATWTVRLAQAYIEQVWTGDFPWTTWAPPATRPRCADYKRARELLDPLAAAGDLNAKAQRARLAPLMRGCDG
jgi:hypothetical protein